MSAQVASPPSAGRSAWRRLGRQIALAAGFQLAAVAFFWQVVFERSRTFLAFQDATDQTYPWLTKIFRALGEGTVAFWDFSVFSGTTFLGESSTGALYPVSWLFGLVSPIGDPLFVELWVVFHFGLAAYLMYALLRDLGVGELGAVAGASAFALVGAVANRSWQQACIFAGLVYLPLAVLCLRRALEPRGAAHATRWSLAAGLTLGTMILAGHLQPYLHAALLLAAFAFFHCVGLAARQWLRALAALAVTAVTSILFAAPQLFPALEYLGRAYRWHGDGFVPGTAKVPYSHYGFDHVLRPEDLASLFDWSWDIADGGTLFMTRVGLVLAAVALFRRSRLVAFAVVVALVSVLVAMGDGTLLGRLSYWVPPFNRVREPIRILSLYAFCAALLIGLGTDRLRALAPRWGSAGRGVLAFVLLLFAGELDLYGGRLHHEVALGEPPARYYARNAVVDALEARQQSWQHAYRAVFGADRRVPPNLGHRYDVFNARGYRATMQRNYFEFLSRGWSFRSPIWDELGVRDVVSAEPIEGFREIARAEGVVLYERPDPLPVFTVATAAGERRAARWRRISWSTNAVTLELEPGDSGTLVFAQPSFPGWRARVDGEPREVGEWGIFLSVPLRAQDREVRLSYRPRGFALYASASGATLLLTAVLFAWRGRHRTAAAA